MRAVLGFWVLEENPYPKHWNGGLFFSLSQGNIFKEGDDDDDDDDDDAFSIVMSEDDPPGNGGEPRRRDQSQRRRRQKNLSLSVPKEDSGEYRWWGRFFFFVSLDGRCSSLSSSSLFLSLSLSL